MITVNQLKDGNWVATIKQYNSYLWGGYDITITGMGDTEDRAKHNLNKQIEYLKKDLTLEKWNTTEN